MPGGEFFPPVQYMPWWGLLGFLIIVVVVAWYVWVFVSTRASKARSEQKAPQAYRPSPEAIRTHYLGMIGDTRAAYVSGELDRREAHHQLSLLLRSYVDEREGVRTLHMTLKDLRRTPLTPLSDAVARLYPGAFSADYPGTVDEAAAEAQRLVNSWR
jgi:hypothetical protein